MQALLPDIPYGPGPRHVGDLLPPASPVAGAAPVLLVHGGGWNSMSKESLAPVARLAAEAGRAVFSINYTLIGQAPFPACRDDCVRAARFVLDGGLASRGLPAPEKLLVCGASAGGHLALLAALALGARACSGAISLAGPSRILPGPDDTEASAISGDPFRATFFGLRGPAQTPAAATVRDATPSALAGPDAPPLLCIHSLNDRLVPLSHSTEAVAAWRSAGASANLVTFDGPGAAHGFWTDGDLSTRQLIPPLRALLLDALRPGAFST